MQLPHPRSPTRPPRPDTRISQVDRPRSHNISSRLLQLAAVWHLQVKSEQTTARAEWSCASRVPSCLELQLGALAQTASQQRIIFKMALIKFNVKSSKQPSYLHSLLDNYTPSRNLGSEGQHLLLRIPLRMSAGARRSFCFGAPTVWNSLNSKTQEADSLESFKTRLKTELFSSALMWSICSSTHSPCTRITLGQFIHCSWTKTCNKYNCIIIIIIIIMRTRFIFPSRT